MGMIDAVKIMRDAELKAESNKITLGEYEAMIRPLRQVMPKADYENRLKVDLEAILTELLLEIEEMDSGCGWEGYRPTAQVIGLIQQKINALKGKV
jgi:hypothetical protein